MRLLTYNILEGGDGEPGRIPLIEQVVQSCDADVVCLQETNGFEFGGCFLLKHLARNTGYAFHAFAPCETAGKKYSVTTYSRLPLIENTALRGLKNAGLLTKLETANGVLAVCNVLFSARGNANLGEVLTAIEALRQNENRILCGDFNALSEWDSYASDLPASFNADQQRRFTRSGALDFRVTNAVKSAGYKDCAEVLGSKSLWTVRTPISTAESHPLRARIDHVFVSANLQNSVKRMHVPKTGLTEQASDHYPVVVELDGFVKQ